MDLEPPGAGQLGSPALLGFLCKARGTSPWRSLAHSNGFANPPNLEGWAILS